MIIEPGSAPRKVQVRPLSSSTMVIQWDEPETPNGQVTVRLIVPSFLIIRGQWEWTKNREFYTHRIFQLIGCIKTFDSILTKFPNHLAYDWRVEKTNYSWNCLFSFCAQGYKVYYTTDPNQLMQSWQSQMVDNNKLTTIMDLTPHTIYTIRVQALTSIGAGPLSPPIQVKTQQGVPSQPENLSAVDIGETEVTLQWSKPAHSAENILSYELYWNDTYARVCTIHSNANISFLFRPSPSVTIHKMKLQRFSWSSCLK